MDKKGESFYCKRFFRLKSIETRLVNFIIAMFGIKSKMIKMGEAFVENRQIDQVIKNIESNIQRCEVLRNVLKSKIAGDSIDYNWYLNRGYKDEEVKIGAELIDLYLILKNYINKRD